MKPRNTFRREPRWLDRKLIDFVQREVITRHGGQHGLRDEGLLESAILRPRQLWHYGAPSGLHSLAASYAFGLARNHPFVDGNKRVSFVACLLFMRLNGLHLEATDDEKADTFWALAAGNLSEAQLVAWLAPRVRG